MIKLVVSNIGRTLAAVSLLSYLVALILEAWRPGFVTFFWNPQLLLILAILGAILGARGEPVQRQRWHNIAFFMVLAILAAILVWQSFPPSGTRLLAIVATVLLIAGAGAISKK